MRMQTINSRLGRTAATKISLGQMALTGAHLKVQSVNFGKVLPIKIDFTV